MVPFYACAEGVLEDFGENVFEVDGDVAATEYEWAYTKESIYLGLRECCVDFAVNDDLGTCAECRLAQLRHKRAHHANHLLG